MGRMSTFKVMDPGFKSSWTDAFCYAKAWLNSNFPLNEIG